MIAEQMAADTPASYVAKMTKKLRPGRIFVDYLRNARGATSVVAYSTRARPGAPVSVPVGWQEIGPKLEPDRFTVQNLRQRLGRLRHDPWKDLTRRRQRLPDLSRRRR